MNDTFKMDSKFLDLLQKQRHECRDKRQKNRTYGPDELYQELYFHFLLFKHYLPRKVKTILDIGCGLGYIDVILSRELRKADLYLFDSMSSNNDKVYNFYNDLGLTREFLKLNGVDKRKIHLVDATSCGVSQEHNDNPEVFKDLPKMDLVVSCYAYGWHSRINKYIREVSELMNTGGLLVLDCKGSKTHGHYEREIGAIKDNGFEHIDSVQVFDGKYVMIARKI